MNDKMKTVYVCSRLRGNTAGMTDEQKLAHMEENIRRVGRICRIIAIRGMAIPIAPHLYFTRFLDDTIEQERILGIKLGLELLDLCDELWVCDTIISEGMKREIEYAQKTGKIVRYIDISVFMEETSDGQNESIKNQNAG